VIYYNDTKNNDGLTRFTIAHELGHIFLQHHNKTKTDIMLREGIAESLYKAFENEANCFARNFLSPQPLVSLITDISQNYSVQEIVMAFNISYPAAITRRKLFNNDSFRIKAENMEFFKTFKINYGYFCLNCGNGDIGPGQYCKICGEKDSVFIKGVNRLFYNDGIELDKLMRVVKCPLCGNEEFSVTAVHCRICGTMLFNLCQGEWDYSSREWYNRHLNPGNARFCEHCGKPTYFNSEDFLEPWEKVKYSLNNNLTPKTDDDRFSFDDFFDEVAVTDE
jgi:hypothetical protein